MFCNSILFIVFFLLHFMLVIKAILLNNQIYLRKYVYMYVDLCRYERIYECINTCVIDNNNYIE
jgi:hypothetical protein